MYHASPHSSSGRDESPGGTPDTKFTAFSPDDARALKPSNVKSAGTPLKASHNDPFVSDTTKPKVEQKLSATASAFQPFGLRVSSIIPSPAVAHGLAPLPNTTQYLNNIIAEASPPRAEVTQFGTFTTDTGATRNIKVSGIYGGEEVLPEVKATLDALGKTFTCKGSLRVESVGNIVYLRLANISDSATIYKAIKKDHINFAVEYMSPSALGQVISPNSQTSYSAHEGQVLIGATYPTNRDVNRKEFEESLRALLAVEGPLCAWQKLSATEVGTFQMVAEFFDASLAPRAVQRCNQLKNGELPSGVVVSVCLHTPDANGMVSHRLTPTATPTRRSGDSSNISDALGRVSLNEVQTPRYSGGAMRAQVPPPMTFMPSSAPFSLPGGGVPVMMNGLYNPTPMASPLPQPFMGIYRQPQVGGNGHAPFSPYQMQGEYSLTGFNRVGFQPQNFRHDFSYYSPGPTGSSPGGGLSFGRPGGRRQNAVKVTQFRGRNHSNPSTGHHNHVEIERIRAGSDVRTTVMLRNIPNKVDQAMLKDIIDESSFGRYDFMYLRIDFSNNCNVGYAFINFTDPLDIIDFVLARSNQKWHRFKSDKVAEISYATIQGRDCLIQKFRNSSVMLEPPHYRPKLFLTIHDPLGRAGEEDQFPASDNASKLKRSCENAEHVGLFAPSAGQHLRDEQRRRRSQYDRGTSLAEREEFGFDDSQIPYITGYLAQY